MHNTGGVHRWSSRNHNLLGFLRPENRNFWNSFTNNLNFNDTDVYKFLIWVLKSHVPKLIKQCPDFSRVMPDIENITNLGKINFRIKILIQTFCTYPPAVY